MSTSSSETDTFPAPRPGREGYDAAQVEAFLGDLERAMRHRPPTIAPYEVADERFRVTRRGRRYDLRAVDEHLDRAERTLRELHGQDAVASLEGRAQESSHRSTWWIYLVGLLLVLAVILFAVTAF